MTYLIPIQTALIIFPLIALLFTIPFILHQYHKYGSINKLRTLIIYSFILYMITIYFLVIMPLPNIKDVTPKDNMIKLIPFAFIIDFLKETTLNITNPETYLKSLTDPCFYTVIFNLLMTVPFGMYLRYYFKCNLKKVIITTFILSLFFEITQLTGLYFIYPYPYRIFDVDDLIINTLGGVIGYYIMGYIDNFLPTREKIDEEAIEAGKKVSGLRRLTTSFLDIFIYLFIITFLDIFIKINNLNIIVFIIYFIIYPSLTTGTTIGSKFLNVKIDYPNNIPFRLTSRTLFIYLYYFKLPIIIFYTLNLLKNIQINMQMRIILFIITLFIISIIYLINIITILKGKQTFYDKIFKSSYKSTILENKDIPLDISKPKSS